MLYIYVYIILYAYMYLYMYYIYLYIYIYIICILYILNICINRYIHQFFRNKYIMVLLVNCLFFLALQLVD